MSGSYDQSYQYQSNYNNQYPSGGFSYSYQSYPVDYQAQPYYKDARGSQDQYSYPQQQQFGTNDSYYGSQQPTQPGAAGPQQENDRGLLGAVAGGAAGAWGGHKAGHGFLGSIGGAIVGSLTEDYAKKHHKQGKQNKHHHKQQQNSHNNNSFASGGLASTASSFFNQKR